MKVVIAGGHGQIALRLARQLADRGDQPVGLIRNPDHADDVRAAGAEPVLLDLESATVAAAAEVLRGADAVVFAAGAGPGSGAARKDTVDRGASALMAGAAESAGVRRFIQVSGMGLDRADDPGVDEVFAAYLRAKAAAEQDLAGRDLDWTILRPGRLTNDAPTGTVTLAPSVGYGEISRDDVAAVLVALLDHPATAGRTLELVGGETPVDQAL
ncbi:SDR family oxidoreductase [Labedaea rhizosphaerae]|uniref:Putative NADH-flavin reductase n=1 Tax=Labedaea rhizosphaerae TaxID=598644 RepID=A0A4R6SPI3_LABRH|nr:SDR family oxidoreductase [Labedaea rhizosphaerae]TDQ05133.1 putative NADH-flavin reductase [Labedaea rhizosphaerae]